MPRRDCVLLFDRRVAPQQLALLNAPLPTLKEQLPGETHLLHGKSHLRRRTAPSLHTRACVAIARVAATEVQIGQHRIDLHEQLCARPVLWYNFAIPSDALAQPRTSLYLVTQRSGEEAKIVASSYRRMVSSRELDMTFCGRIHVQTSPAMRRGIAPAGVAAYIRLALRQGGPLCL
jgi:hypothetical protein